MSSISLAGLAIASGGVNQNSIGTLNAGLALTTGALTIGSAQKLFSKISDIERSKLVPEDHLYTPTSIPPHLVMKKWLLLQKNQT